MKKNIAIVFLAVLLCFSVTSHAFAAERINEVLYNNDSNNHRDIIMNIMQVKQREWYVTVNLSSTVYGTGSPIHYRYDTINYAYPYCTNTSSVHLIPTSWYNHLELNNTVCVVEYSGNLYDGQGNLLESNKSC